MCVCVNKTTDASDDMHADSLQKFLCYPKIKLSFPYTVLIKWSFPGS